MGSTEAKNDNNPNEILDPIEVIRQKILAEISEGIMLIGFNGNIIYANKTASKILGIPQSKMTGHSFISLFFDKPEKDEFTQAIIDSVYDREKRHDMIVTYTSGNKTTLLRMMTSFYADGEKRKGIIAVFSDVSEIMELRDSVKSMKKIQKLNEGLELRNKLLSETFGRFLSDEIVKKLLDTPDGLKLGGQKKNITMMMSDLRGFTALSEHLDAGDLIKLLNHYLEEMTVAIQEYGGTIIEFIGDGILAVFGAPDYYEDHASKAVAAALLMQSKMEDVNKWNAERDYPTLEMGIGINSGEVIVGNIGSEKRTKYGVAGSAVNLCGRIESYTIGGQILIPTSTMELIKEDLEIETRMTVYPKGAQNELALMQITGIGAPYDIHLKQDNRKPVPLDKPAPVCFYKLERKHKLDGTFFGGIISVTEDRAVLSTDTQLEVFDHIQIEAGGDLYCRVIEKLDEGYLLQYTSIPAGYEEWITQKGKKSMRKSFDNRRDR